MTETESERLEGTRAGVFLAPEGTEEVEFTEPKQAVSDAGARVDVLGVETGEADTVNDDLDPGDTYEVERSFSEVSPDEYDALIVRGAPSARTNFASTTMRWSCYANTSRPTSRSGRSATAPGRWSRRT